MTGKHPPLAAIVALALACCLAPASVAQLPPHPGGVYDGILDAESALNDCLALPGAEVDTTGEIVRGYVVVPWGECVFDFGEVRFLDAAVLSDLVVRVDEVLFLLDWQLEMNGDAVASGSVSTWEEQGWGAIALGSVPVPFGNHHILLRIHFEGDGLKFDGIWGSPIIGPITEIGCGTLFSDRTCKVVWEVTDFANETLAGPIAIIMETLEIVLDIVDKTLALVWETADETCYENLSPLICDEVFG